VPPSAREFFRAIHGGRGKVYITSSGELSYQVKDGDPRYETVQSGEGTTKHPVLPQGHHREDERRTNSPGRTGFLRLCERARSNSDDPADGLDLEKVRLWGPSWGSRSTHRNLPPERRPMEAPKSLREATGTNVGIGPHLPRSHAESKTDNRSMTFVKLRDKIQEERKGRQKRHSWRRGDLWGKISTPLASLIFGCWALHLNPVPSQRQSHGFGVAIALIFVLDSVYLADQIGKNGGLPPLPRVSPKCYRRHRGD